MTYAPRDTYDVVVIGGGPVGENVADRAGRTGLSVVLVEAELLGGECSYWACMPSKALLRPGAALAAARAVPGVSGPGGLDATTVLGWRDEVARRDDGGQVRWLDGAGIDLIRGHARLAGERVVVVTTADGGATTVHARYAVVAATGSVPVVPAIPGLADVDAWGSREATTADTVPASLAIVGGGVVACEMATAYADLGATVTLLARGPLLARAEPFAGRAVADALRASGVDVRTGVAVGRVERGGDGVVVHVEGATVGAERLLVATGRVPRTGDLGVDTVGLTPGKGLVVDDSMTVRDVPGGWFFGAGDVTGRSATTHQGKYEARVVGDVIATRFGPLGTDPDRTPWTRYVATADTRAATQVVFTRPQVASVGSTEAEARAAGVDVTIVRQDLSSAAGTSLMGSGCDGIAQLVVDADREVVVGATFVGPDAAEMLHAATIAVVGEVPLARLWHAVPAYPTVSEVWLRLLEAHGL